MCNTSKDVQYKRECAVQLRHIFNTNKNVQYKQRAQLQHRRGCAVQAGRSSSFGTGGTTLKYFPMNESSFFLVYSVKTFNSLWQATETNSL